MKDYTGKTIYLGMDVHKDSYSVTSICEGEIVKRDRLPADPKHLLSYCNRFFPNGKIISAYEAGFCGFSLHRFLLEHHIENIVVHPASIEMQLNDRVKTDKRDSLKIATQLSLGRLRGIFVPTPEQEALRSISRFRGTLIKQKTSCVNRIKGFLHFLGIKFLFTRMSKAALAKLRKIELKDDNKFCLDLMLDEWENIKDKIRICEEKLKLQSKNDELDKFYRSTPGIGNTTARILSNELGDFSQFSNEKQLFSYCGLTPSEYSSGEKIRRGHITRQGKSFLRMYLTQSAWRAIRKDPALEDIFKRISTRAGSKRAIQAIARKLIGRIRSCVMKKKLYEIGIKG